MKDSCASYWEEIVEIAEGADRPAARAHIQSCRDCAEKLALMEKFSASANLGFFDAPAKDLLQAKNLMPEPQRRTATLLRSTLVFSGARTVSEDFQLVVGIDRANLRLMYVRDGQGWRVLGKLPSESVSISSPADAQVEEDGRFSFYVSDLAEAEFTLIENGMETVVPAPYELTNDGLGLNS